MLSVLTIALLAYAGICVYFYLFQRSLLYYPTAEVSAAGLTAETVPSGSEAITVWRSAEDFPDAAIYFGGNAETVALSHNQYRPLLPAHTIYLVEYRGYGRSTGSPTEAGLLADALAVFDRVAATHRRVILIGRSLGTGMVTHVGARRPVHGLVLITPYDSIAAVGQSHFPWLPVRWLLQDKYRSEANAPAITAPTLVIGATADRVVPLRHAERLTRAFRQTEPKLVIVPGADHITVSDTGAFSESIRDFVQEVASP
ncbi:MAG: alpha/beta fold hydrolase [Pseudomonadota bacterium]